MLTIEPKISIITPSYNQGQFIEATILSVLNQTYQNIEYILIDGGSTDDTMDVVNRYRDQINIVIHEKDSGQSNAINKGFRAATGDLVGWINSDDILYPDCVERIVNLYKQHPDGAVYYGEVLHQIDELGAIIVTRHVPIPNRQFLLLQNYELAQQGSFYPTRLVQEVGYLNETIHYCMDLDLWLKLLNHGPIYACVGKPISGFRIWGETKTSTGGTKFLANIREVLLNYGASPYSKAVLKTQYYIFRANVKKTLRAR